MRRSPERSGPGSSTLQSPGRAAAALALLACAACGGGGPDLAGSEGQALYEAECAICHGAGGLGDGPMAASLPVPPPSLLEHLGHHPADQLREIILTGVPPAMPPAPLTEAEVRLVVDYAWTLVPDSLVERLRELQRLAEMGMPMDMGGDTSSAMPGMDHSGHAMPPDTTRR